MFNLSTLIDRIRGTKSQAVNTDNTNAPNSSNSIPDAKAIHTTVTSTKNWYEERTAKILTQRNLLTALTFLLLLLITVSIIAITIVLNLRRFDPFVIQIDDSTGGAKVVNPVTSDFLLGNDELAKFFIKKYVIARETYNPVDFTTSARNVVRLCSTGYIYRDYIGYITSKTIDPTVLYAQKNTTFLIVKSWSKLDTRKYLLRFSINETAESKKVFNRIAIIDYNYIPMELSESDRDVNPIGFQVQGYRVDDDNS